MSWTNELYRVYELAVGTDDGKNMLPISHKIENAHIEIEITEEGELATGTGIAIVGDDEKETVIPDSGKSRTGKYPAPYPLNDTLRYLAGDFNDYVSEAIKNNTRNHDEYMKQLSDWCNSSYTHSSVNAIYKYLKKNTTVYDCIQSGVLSLDKSTGKLKDVQLGVSVDKCFIRFKIQYSESDKESLTWKDKSLYDSYIDYMNSKEADKQLCYATGKLLAPTYIHPIGIVKSNARAKLISANDTANYTFRGRFTTKEEAVSVSYDYSQKMHNALKWLRERQSRSYDSLTLITWNSALDFVPSMTESVFDQWEDETEEYSTKPKFSEMMNKMLMRGTDGKRDISSDSKVMIMGLDAATTGRLSIAIYTELAESEFYANLKKWHNDTKWRRFKPKLGKNILDSCSLPQIANCLYGTEQGNFLECDKKILGDTILRLLPCVAERRKLPRDIVQTICIRASSPLSFDNEHNHRLIVENACALIRKEHIDYKKGEIKMAYDPTCTDRSYLFGCLLAIADKAERDTYDREKDKNRITNARRFWNVFSSRPYQTWQIIEERLEPYLEKESWVMTKYTKHLNEIMSKMSPEDFENNDKLSPMYLIGFHHYNALLWNGSEENNEEE